MAVEIVLNLAECVCWLTEHRIRRSAGGLASSSNSRIRLGAQHIVVAEVVVPVGVPRAMVPIVSSESHRLKSYEDRRYELPFFDNPQVVVGLLSGGAYVVGPLGSGIVIPS